MHPTLTYNDTLAAYQNYPAPIRPFLLRAETHPVLRTQLTKSFMRVFIDVLGRAPIADPLRPLWLRNDIVAENLNLSTKTVSRALHFMKQKEWLNPYTEDDGRNDWGQFSTNKFLLGDELRTLLGLPTTQANPMAETIAPPPLALIATPESETTTTSITEPNMNAVEATYVPTPEPAQLPAEEDREPQQEIEPSVGISVDEAEVNHPTETKMSHGLYTVNNVFLKEASVEQEASETKAEPQKTNGKAIHLPESLKPLQQELGIDPRGIFKLMSIAKKVKQRLQHVWLAKRDQILSAGATGGRAFNYLKFLLETGEDFAFRARNVAIKKDHLACDPLTRSDMSASPVADNHHRFRNKRFTGDNGLLIQIHGDGSATVNSKTEKNAYVRPADVVAIVDAIKAGRLKQIEE